MANTLVYTQQGGDRLVVADGGQLSVEGELNVSGTVIFPPHEVTKADIGMFISSNQTGTGSPQNIPHGLGVDPTPANLMFSIMEINQEDGILDGVIFDAISTDDTNITVTVPEDIVFRVMAFLP